MASNNDRIKMTREGYEKLKAELDQCNSKVMVIAKKIEEAKGFGDLSENAEYHAAKEEQAKNDDRIRELQFNIRKADIIDVEDIDVSKASLGTTVTIEDKKLNKIFTYTLVGTEEADVKAKRISVECPVGKAVIGKSKGDEFIARAPKGIRHLRLIDIRIK